MLGKQIQSLYSHAWPQYRLVVAALVGHSGLSQKEKEEIEWKVGCITDDIREIGEGNFVRYIYL